MADITTVAHEIENSDKSIAWEAFKISMLSSGLRKVNASFMKAQWPRMVIQRVFQQLGNTLKKRSTHV